MQDESTAAKWGMRGMMAEPTGFEIIAFSMFVAACLYFVSRVFTNPGNFMTLPVVSAAVWLTYAVPQAFGIMHYPRFIPAQLYYNGFGQSMIMAALCLIAAVLGWRVGFSRPLPRKRLEIDVTSKGLFYLGGLFTILGWLSFIYVTGLSGGIFAHYSVGGNYDLDWMGGEVIAAFFKRSLFNVGVIFLAFSVFMRPKLVSVFVLIVAVLPAIGDILLLNRRSEVFFLALSLGAPAFFVRGWVPSRKMLISFAIAGMFVVFTFPIIRGAFLIGAEKNVDMIDSFRVAFIEQVIGGETQKEFNNTIGVIASDWITGEFGLGRNIWNLWINTTIPRTLFGSGIKEALKFDGVGFADVASRASGWLPAWYQSYTSAAMLFHDFWYFGAAVFYVVGYVFAKIYHRAIMGSNISKIQYAAFLLLLPHWIAVGFAKAPRDILLTLMLLALTRLVFRKVSRDSKTVVINGEVKPTKWNLAEAESMSRCH